jgi:hypothetical protein
MKISDKSLSNFYNVYIPSDLSFRDGAVYIGLLVTILPHDFRHSVLGQTPSPSFPSHSFTVHDS